MIFDAIFGALLALLSAVFTLLPVHEAFAPVYEGEVNGFGQRVAEILLTLDLFVPIKTFFVCIAAILAAKAFAGVVALIVFLWDKLPFKST